jgi:hypothetical protein
MMLSLPNANHTRRVEIKADVCADEGEAKGKIKEEAE